MNTNKKNQDKSKLKVKAHNKMRVKTKIMAQIMAHNKKKTAMRSD